MRCYLCGSPEGARTEDELRPVVTRTLDQFSGVRKVLLVHNDYLRHDPTPLIAPIIYECLRRQGLERLDTLNAPGTHCEMSLAQLNAKIGMCPGTHPRLGNRYNHDYGCADRLTNVGVLSEEFIGKQTQGHFRRSVPVTVNSHLFDGYDLIVALSATKDHEGTGKSGGTKIIIPGIAGREIIGSFHWATVLVGIPNIIGKVENPGRAVLDEAVKLVFSRLGGTPIVSFNMVSTDRGGQVDCKGLFTGVGFEGFRSALHGASALSDQVHVIYLDQEVHTAVQCISADSYDEIWTAGKGSYYLQKPGVLARGAEIIIFAPHITCFHSNAEMDEAIRKIGYHGRDEVVQFCAEHTDFDLNVASHSINVRGIDPSAFKVTLATGISEADCQAVGLGYRDPETIREQDFQGPGQIWIPNGGVDLYARR